MCQGNHPLFKCKDFNISNVDAGLALINRTNSCVNFLGNHKVEGCKSNKTCKTCFKRHNTMLHQFQKRNVESTCAHQSTTIDNTIQSTFIDNNKSQVILPTAIDNITGINWQVYTFRCLLDQGSHHHLLSLRKQQISCNCAEHLSKQEFMDWAQ